MKYKTNQCKIKPGQLWKKKDTGQIIRITKKSKDNYWLTEKTNGTKKTHHIYEKDLWIFWKIVTANAL